MKNSPLSVPEPIDTSTLGGPFFLITIDTEEEFDWDGPFTRDQHGTTHVPAIERFQKLCDVHSVKPVYLIDYPIANDDRASELLGRYAKQGRAEIGVQLHPWVNPPFDEQLCEFNSFASNLDPQLERAKLSQLHALIVDKLGVNPDIYRAGRYGAGEYTPQILQDLGISIDTSVRSHFDYSPGGGPDYSGHGLNPYWLAPDKLLEIPVTTVFAGLLQCCGSKMFRHIFASDAARSALARSGLLERIALTPEGIPVEKAKIGIDAALKQGVPILNFSFHSPSLEAGHLGYTETDEDLENFYHWWDEVFAHLAARNVQPISPSEIKKKFAL